MNKFSEIRQGGVRDGLMFIKRLGFNATNTNDIWAKFDVTSRDADDVEMVKSGSKMFTSHPKRLESDTDENSVFSTPRRISVSSSTMDVNAELGPNMLKIKNKLHKAFTRTEYSESGRLEVGICDSTSVTPSYTPSCDKVQFDKERHVTIQSEVDGRSKNGSIAASKKSQARKQNYQRNVVTESMFEKKFKTFVEKSLHIISDVRATLDRGVPPPDGDEDMSRRIVRVKEFSNRFSRNYLYPLARQMDELGKLDSHHANVHPKLLSAYNVILNGLQAYHSHLPSSIGTCSSDKLQILLRNVLHLCDIHTNLIKHPDENGFSDFVSTYKLNAELTLKKIEDYFTAVSTDSILKSASTKLSLGAKKSNKFKGNPKRNALESRLSMYSVTAAFRKDPQWKKAVDSYARKKLNVKSRYKTATYRHRPPIEKGPEIIVLPSKCKLFSKRPPAVFKKSPPAVFKKSPPATPPGDNITTMVQIEDARIKADHDVNAGSLKNTETLNHKEIVMKLLHLVLDNTQRRGPDKEQNATSDGVASTESQIADILRQLRNEGDAEALQKILDTLQRKTMDQNELQLKIIQSQESLEGGAVKKRKEPTVTAITGENNVRLICIKDENSIIEIESNSEWEKKDSQTEKVIPLKFASKTRTDLKKVNKNMQKSFKNAHVKMNRLPKSSKCLQTLPKVYAVNVIQYKLDFNKHCKTNPLYRKTTSVTPWVLMGKISDKILDQSLLTVAREIEVNDIAQRIYESELQL